MKLLTFEILLTTIVIGLLYFMSWFIQEVSGGWWYFPTTVIIYTVFIISIIFLVDSKNTHRDLFK